jgi:lipopolysaccharide export system permease protein
MRILDRYIVKSLIGIFLASLLIFFFLYLIIDIFSNLGDFLEWKVSLKSVVEYYLSFLPVIFSQTAPFVCLLSVLFSLGRLNSNNEIIAIRTAGLNFWQITKSAICFGMVVSAIIFWVNEKIVPQAVMSSNNIREEKMSRQGKPRGRMEVIRNFTFYGLKNRLYFVDTLNPNDNYLEGITILEQDKKQNLRSKIVALKGTWTQNNWKFQQCQIFYFDPNGQMNDKTEYFEEKIMDITETPKELLRQRIQVSSMSIRQLKEYINKFSDSGAATILRNLRVDLHQRIAYPFSSPAIMFVGMPFAMMTKRRKGVTFAQLGICISIGFFYYVINAVGLAFGKGGIFVPFISAWMANIIFCLTAIYLIIKTR